MGELALLCAQSMDEKSIGREGVVTSPCFGAELAWPQTPYHRAASAAKSALFACATGRLYSSSRSDQS